MRPPMALVNAQWRRTAGVVFTLASRGRVVDTRCVDIQTVLIEDEFRTKADGRRIPRIRRSSFKISLSLCTHFQ